jgi:hypothetical protein
VSIIFPLNKINFQTYQLCNHIIQVTPAATKQIPNSQWLNNTNLHLIFAKYNIDVPI